MNCLQSGDLYGFEESLHCHLMDCYNETAQVLLMAASKDEGLRSAQRDLAQTLGLGKLVFRDCHIQLCTGFWFKTHHKFNTPWKEPKMLVINILDKDGKNDRNTLPIYDVAFWDDDVVEVLRRLSHKYGNWVEHLFLAK
jgi:hypothetical protein